jgi:hypothetical protein
MALHKKEEAARGCRWRGNIFAGEKEAEAVPSSGIVSDEEDAVKDAVIPLLTGHKVARRESRSMGGSRPSCCPT